MAFTNNLSTTLHSIASAGATRIQIRKATPPWQDPPVAGKLVLQDSVTAPTAIEIISYTRRNDNGEYWTITEVSRGLEGTLASRFLAGAYVFGSFTAQDATDLAPLRKPVPTYTEGVLTRMDYAGGAFKVFTYNGEGQCTSVTTTNGEVVLTDEINWVDGVFSGIT